MVEIVVKKGGKTTRSQIKMSPLGFAVGSGYAPDVSKDLIAAAAAERDRVLCPRTAGMTPRVHAFFANRGR